MGNNPFGIKTAPSEDKAFRQSLFYFIKEFGINPFDEEYEVRDNKGKLKLKIIKRGISLPLFNSLMEEMKEHYKREADAMKKGRK